MEILVEMKSLRHIQNLRFPNHPVFIYLKKLTAWLSEGGNGSALNGEQSAFSSVKTSVGAGTGDPSWRVPLI